MHFYTASATERDYVSQNLPQYQYEGASYQAAPENNDSLTGAKPVYRLKKAIKELLFMLNL